VTAGKNHNCFKKWFLSGFQLVFCHIFKIKFIEVGEPAVPAPHDKVPAADGQVVGTSDMAVTAFGRFNKFPEIITTDLRELPFFTDILDPGNENPGCAAVVADYLCLVWNCPDDLVGIFLAMITVRAVPRKDEMFAHKR
jgi:hypothetical protein